MSVIFLNDAFVSEQEAKIPVSDRGFQFGDGAFATIQVKEGIPLFLATHLEKLKKQCESFNLAMPHIEESVIDELIHLNQAETGIWRLKIIVTGGDCPEIRLCPREGRVVILLKPFVAPPIKPLNMGIFPSPYHLCHASYKSLAHLNRFYVLEEAYKQGVDDCVTLTERGVLLEAAFANLFWVKERSFYTPAPDLPLYFGVTIKNCIKIATKLGYDVHYVKLHLNELPKGACCFRTNTMGGIWPVANIGEHTFALNQTVIELFLNGYEAMISEQKKAVSSL